jgi:hypothetical protein
MAVRRNALAAQRDRLEDPMTSPVRAARPAVGASPDVNPVRQAATAARAALDQAEGWISGARSCLNTLIKALDDDEPTTGRHAA